MAIITKIFNYEGGVRIAEVPAGTASVTIHLWGGAGGGGANEVGSGGAGASGHYVTKTDLDMTAYAGVKHMSISVGGGGAGGTLGAGAEGGALGNSLSGYSGGKGGQSGPDGPSGSGGGGGGATVFTVFDDGAAFDQTVLAVAGGGGGGGGGAALSSGAVGKNTTDATSASPGTLGENGAKHGVNGAGAGAGGGGADGGKGGSADQGDIGAFGGASGTDTVPASGSSDNGSGVTPGGQASGYYSSGVATGGASNSAGGNGKAVLIFNIPSASNYKVGGAWKKLDQMYYKHNNVWKSIRMAYTKVGGVWKAIFANDIQFTINFAGFGNENGNPASGTVGTAGQPADQSQVESGGGGGGGQPRGVPQTCKQQYWGPITTKSPLGYQCKSNENNGGTTRVICTYFYGRGEFDLQDLKNDTEFSRQSLSDEVKIGYWIWAIPLVDWMKKHEQSTHWWPKLVINATRLFATTRAKELSYKMGTRTKGSMIGKMVRLVGEGGCYIVGTICKPFIADKYLEFLKEYNKDVNLIR